MRVRSLIRSSMRMLNWYASCLTRNLCAVHNNVTTLEAHSARNQFVWYHCGKNREIQRRTLLVPHVAVVAGKHSEVIFPRR